RAQEQPVDVVAPVEVEREIDHFARQEPRARHVAGSPVDTVLAVVLAEIGKQYLQQRDAPAVGRETVADARARAGAQPRAPFGVAARRAAAGAGRVVLGGVSQNFKLGGDFHILYIYTAKLPAAWCCNALHAG